MNTSERHVEVLISGAGPTGLTLACDLARRGVSVRLIEKSPVPFTGSRGRGLQPRTQEVFADLGVIDKIHEADGLYPPIRTYRNGELIHEARMAEYVAPSPSEPYSNPWMIPQWRTEEILRARFTELSGKEVEFGTELAAFVQDGVDVTAILNRDGVTEQVHAQYLVGADGGHSLVRRILDIPFEGETDETIRMLVADVSADGIDREYWRAFQDPVDPNHVISLCPMAGTDAFQVVMPVQPDTPAEPTADYLQSVLEQWSGRSDIQLHDLTWATIWRSNVRMVQHVRRGRVFLAGDSAHVHPPAGGQGLNTGVQDAYNLGWKLGVVLSGGSEELLDTYEAERLPIAAGVLGLSAKLLGKGLRGEQRKTLRGRDTQQLDLSYRDGPLARDERTDPGELRAGDRAPDAPCQDSQGRATTVFNAFRGPHFTLLAFGAEHAETVAAIDDRFEPLVRGHVIVRSGEPVQPNTLVDVDGHIAAAYDLHSPALVLIRPDGYLGLVSAPGTVASVESYLRSPVHEPFLVD
jgi:2-polyprenyl-6-methoxyphenol hydroxylase-like FAD-dependent oxidoreductase